MVQISTNFRWLEVFDENVVLPIIWANIRRMEMKSRWSERTLEMASDHFYGVFVGPFAPDLWANNHYLAPWVSSFLWAWWLSRLHHSGRRMHTENTDFETLFPPRTFRLNPPRSSSSGPTKHTQLGKEKFNNNATVFFVNTPRIFCLLVLVQWGAGQNVKIFRHLKMLLIVNETLWNCFWGL